VLTQHPNQGQATPPPNTTPATSTSPSNTVTSPSTPTTTPTTASPTVTPTTTVNQAAAQNEAHSVDNLLSSGATSSELLSEATTDAKNCSSPLLSNDVNEIRQVRDQRQAALTQAEGLNTADLTNGAQLKANLIAALQASLTADVDYLNWARLQEDPSTCIDNSSPSQAGTDNDTAVAAKAAFLNLWNPVASQYGLQNRGPGDM
jgi:hypothetical protein